jgi:hypothetical protein
MLHDVAELLGGPSHRERDQTEHGEVCGYKDPDDSKQQFHGAEYTAVSKTAAGLSRQVR